MASPASLALYPPALPSLSFESNKSQRRDHDNIFPSLLSCPKISMSAISHLAPATCGHGIRDRFLKTDAFALRNAGGFAFKRDRLRRISQLGLSTEKTAASRYPIICMALVDERLALSREAAKPPGVLAYDLIQGALVRWSITKDKLMPEPPTAVLLHGILGSRKNWGSFARRLAQEFPTWQFLLVDLRCHGDSAMMKKRGPHTVSATALDVLKLVAQLRLTPRILIGHSFGGKVALSMVEQAAKPLARPVRVWVLDATPGKVRPGGHKDDHPAELIAFLNSLPKEVASKRDVIRALVHEGFSKEVAQWVATSLRPSTNSSGLTPTFTWAFDLNGISELFKSYEETNMWKIVDDVPGGVHINFLKAERSLHRWALEDIQRIRTAEEMAAEEGGAVEMHVLEDAGHWVHADNPDGLFRILSSSFRVFK